MYVVRGGQLSVPSQEKNHRREGAADPSPLCLWCLTPPLAPTHHK